MVTLDQQGMHALEAKCSQESPPRCQALCPFNVDVRGCLRHVGTGNFREARRLLQRNLPLPGIFARICDHPCESACLRADLGGALAVGSIEQCIVSSAGQQGGGLPMPRKRFRITVAGLGCAGLVCAQDLAFKGYPVLCLHEGRPEDALLKAFPALGEIWDTPNGPAADWQRLAAKVEFRQVEHLDEALISQCAQETDALFVDAGVCDFAPPRDAVEAATLHWKENICLGGWGSQTATGHAYCSPSQSGGEGRTAALTMERIVGGVSLTASREKDTRSPHMELDGIAASPRLMPADGKAYTLNEAQTEARRCLECQCLICVKACAYMQKYKGHPRVFARMIFNNLTIAQGIRKANSLIDSCALCRQCEELCPEHFSMADLCLAAREDMVHKEFMPPSAFEFAMEDMDSASGDTCRLVHPGSSGKSPKYVFFPGCQLSGCRPDQVAAVYAHLEAVLEGGTGIYLSCCGIPARWAGERERFEAHVAAMREELNRLGNPTVITACSTCLSVFREFFTGVSSTSLWEVLDSHELPPGGGRAHAADLPASLVIQDPCTARRDEGWQKAVRSLAAKCGLKLTEPRLSGRLTACCGYGGNQWCSDPETAELMAKDRAKALGGPSLASCIMCRERMAGEGLACWHLLDILPFGRPHEGGGASSGVGLSARRASRARLRRMLLKTLTGEVLPEPVPVAKVRYSTEMLAKLEAKHILQEDVEGTLAFGRSSGRFFIDTEGGHRLTSWRPRNVTFWVEYTEDEDGTFVVHDAWCHRMRVPGAGGESASNAVADEITLEGGH